MIYPVVAELDAKGLPVAVACRLLGVSTSGYYTWRSARSGPASPRRQADEALGEQIRQIHRSSRGTYGSPRVHAELRLAAGVRCSRKRVARLMRAQGLQGVHRRRRKGCTVRDPVATPAADLVNRRFTADRPDALWVTDITQHRTGQGWVYCAVVMDVFARRVVGWSIADHLRTELVIDALDMARWRRKPKAGNTIVHSDHGTQYTSWAFGQRLRQAGLLASMGSIGDCYDNSMIESFSPPCNWNYSTASHGPPASSWPTPSSNRPNPGTTRSDGTRPLATCLQSTTNDSKPISHSRRDHHTEPVRKIGSSSGCSSRRR
jgi:putative transposase